MTYTGLFLRHYIGDTPSGPHTTTSNAPDIILVGEKPVEPSTLVTKESYEAEPPDTLFVGEGNPNYVYVRGLNATAGALTSRVWLWYAEPNGLLWPQKWIHNTIYVDGALRNWVNVSASSPEQIVVGEAFVIVSPPAPQDHYCMVAIAENPPLGEPEVPPFPGAFASMTEFAAWIQEHPNAAWRNTVDTPVEGGTWSWNTRVAGPEREEELLVGALCKNMPVGSFYEWTVPAGVTKAGKPWPMLTSGKMEVKEPGQMYSLPTTWPANVEAGMTITWWANGKSWEKGATIEPTWSTRASALEGLVADPFKGSRKCLLMREPGNVEDVEVVHLHVVGGVPIRMQ